MAGRPGKKATKVRSNAADSELEQGPVFRVDAATATHADVLAAVGLADLLQGACDTPVRIEAAQLGFVVRAPHPVRATEIPRGAGYPYLCPNEKSRAAVPAGIDAVDYVEEKARAERYRKAVEASHARRVSSRDLEQQVAQDRPRPDWPLLKALNALQGDEGTNRVFIALASMSAAGYADFLRGGLQSIAQARPSGIDIGASAVQIFAPTSAKGYARMKPDSVDRNDKTVARWSDHFVEWLRYRGYFRCACPRMLDKDVRMLVPIPGNISIAALRRVAAGLSEHWFGSAKPKVDALASLELARALILHSEEYHPDTEEAFPGLSLKGLTPAAVVSGLHVTHYQNMGSAKAVSAMGVVALPGWFPILSAEDASTWLTIVDEHIRILRGLHDNHSEDIGMLATYRAFLQARGELALEHLLEFLARYGSHWMRSTSTKNKLRQPSSTNLRSIVMGVSPSLSSILDDRSFGSVADAVRRATVSAQALKAMGKKDYREIRYGLLEELRRTRNLPGNAFVERVSEFVSKYNAENAKRREMERLRKLTPRNVTTEEFAGFVRLVELHGAPLVGALLAAHASCKRTEEPDIPTDATEEPAAAPQN